MTDFQDSERPETNTEIKHDPVEDEPAVIISTEKKKPTGVDEPVATLPGTLINYLIIAAVFLGVGLLLGMNMNNDNGVDATTLRVVVAEAVQDAMTDEIATIMSDAVANMSLTSNAGSAFDEEELSAMIADAVQSANEQRSFMIGDDPYVGPEDAPVVVVEFSDFLCTFCGRHYDQTLTPLLENYDGLIRYVYRDYPSVGGQNAVESALAAECANDQDKFWEYHNILFDQQERLLTNNMSDLRGVLIDHATALELDVETFTTCLDTDQHLTDVIEDSSEGQRAGVRGTPGFFINGVFLSGAQPYETFASLINDQLTEQGITPPDIDGDEA